MIRNPSATFADYARPDMRNPRPTVFANPFTSFHGKLYEAIYRDSPMVASPGFLYFVASCARPSLFRTSVAIALYSSCEVFTTKITRQNVVASVAKQSIVACWRLPLVYFHTSWCLSQDMTDSRARRRKPLCPPDILQTVLCRTHTKNN